MPWVKQFRALSATKGTDTAMPLQRIYNSSNGVWNGTDEEFDEVKILTDRSIYRPGQTIYIKGIAYAQEEIPPRFFQMKLIRWSSRM